jgi:hypothetical protein
VTAEWPTGMSLEEHVRQLVAQAPPLSEEQRSALAAILDEVLGPERHIVPGLRPAEGDEPLDRN